ncbi:MAG TPA: error-prone DNA polymerase [Pyrinomonadaceae bacterium]|nr:error-prone DNA polymerase [Pyrinomonadaceae bacterium]
MFYELHTRSAFSFLSSGSPPEVMAARAAELGMPGAALLDRDTLAGAVRFHFEAREKGIKPIIGAEITMEDGSLLPLVPMNLGGYQNLSKLITTIKLRHKKGEHYATREDIEEHSDGLLCFTGGADGFMHNSIKNRRGQADIAWLKYVFGGRLYIELQRHHLRHEEDLNQSLLALSHKLHLPYFASNGPCYATEGERELFDVFTCIKNHCTIYEAGKILSENGEREIRPERQMFSVFEDYPEAVSITEEIASRVDFAMEELSYTFPDYPVPAGETMMSFLRAKTRQRAMERYRGAKKDVLFQIQVRLEKEFAIIEMKKLAGYFLVVSDISDFCRSEGILSQGRGSAANSVVCYALGITAVDPIEHKLLFERFLSEKYEQYPDIDIDLPSGDDREKVIQHVYQKYGERGAGMTANVITYRGRSALREVGKVFGFDAETLGKLSKLNSHYEIFESDELRGYLKNAGLNNGDDRRIRKFAELFTRILDFPRHLGQHSGGMVVSLGRLDGIVPIEPASMEGRSIIQWDKDDCERLKIVKVDLLGLGMMAVLRDSIALIKQHHGRDLDLYMIPQDDPTVYEALQKGDTVGMFQVESRAQIAFLPKSKPRTFYDIVVQVAIIRPGPVVGNMLSAYIDRRQGLEEITYPHPSLKPILERTLGVPLFQEQLLKMAMDIASFSGAEAEELRRAMGFKRPDRRMEQISRNLRDGMTRNNIPTDVQEKIVDYVKAFANYGFPESHAFSFALLAYASAYFILHYRACFMTAMFNNYPLGFYSAATLVKDAQRHGLHFLPLDINRSQYEFTVEEAGTESERPSFAVRVGLKYVRGVREEIGKQIIAARDGSGRLCRSICGEACLTEQPSSYIAASPLAENGGTAADGSLRPAEKHSFSANRAAEPFKNCSCDRGTPYTSVEDLVRRVPAINKREIRALSIAGALNFENTVHRREALWQSELALRPMGPLFENAELEIEDTSSNSSFLRRMEGLELVDADLRKTGISIGRHPMAFVRDDLEKKGILSAVETRMLRAGDIVSVAGAVIVRQRPMTAKNVVFMTLEDETGHSNFVVMPDVFERYRAVINQNDYLIIKGIFEERGMIKALHFIPMNKINTEVVSHNFR